jgi:hypothetical protein
LRTAQRGRRGTERHGRKNPSVAHGLSMK